MSNLNVEKRDGLTIARSSGPLPIEEVLELTEQANQGAIVDLVLTRALNASMVVGSSEACQAERARLGITRLPPERLEGMTTEQRIEEWLARGHVGKSSETLALYMLGRDYDHLGDSPRDADDFERCSLLLQWAPALRDRLIELHNLSPTWGRIAEQWEGLEDLLAKGHQYRPMVHARLLATNEG